MLVCIFIFSLYSAVVLGFKHVSILDHLLFGIKITAITYLAILAHELGHFLSAKYLKVKIESVYFLWYGVGVGLGEEGLTTKTKFWTLFFGPFINLAIGCGLLLIARYIQEPMKSLSYVAMFFNLLLGIVSFFPVSPFDGAVLIESGYKIFKGEE